MIIPLIIIVMSNFDMELSRQEKPGGRILFETFFLKNAAYPQEFLNGRLSSWYMITL